MPGPAGTPGRRRPETRTRRRHGALPLSGDSVRWRVWAPRAGRADLVLYSGDTRRSHALKPEEPGWYFHSLEGVRSFDVNGTEMLVWGNYTNVIAGAAPVNIYYSTDGGQTFGPGVTIATVTPATPAGLLFLGAGRYARTIEFPSIEHAFDV